MAGILAGLAAGYGEAQGRYNQKMLEFQNEHAKTMSTLYGHLADQAETSDEQEEFARRSLGWANDNMMLNPKAHRALIKQEKDGLHGIIDQGTQAKISDYHQKNFVTPTVQGDQSTPSAPTPVPGLTSQTSGTSAPQPTPTLGTSPALIPPSTATPTASPQPQTVAAPPSMSGATGATSAGPSAGPPLDASIPSVMPAAGGQTVSPMTPPVSSPNTGVGGFNGMPIPSIEDLTKQFLGDKPRYTALGRATPDYKMAQGMIPDILKQRVELQNRLLLMQNMLGKANMDPRSPTGSGQLAEMARGMGIPWPTPNWHYLNAEITGDDGKTHNVPVAQNYRDGSTWVREPGGKDFEVFPTSMKPQVHVAPDGSAWSISNTGVHSLSGNVPTITGTRQIQYKDPITGQTQTKTMKVFSDGHEEEAQGAIPTIGTNGIPVDRKQHKPTGGPPADLRPASRTPFDFAALSASENPQDQIGLQAVQNPESWDQKNKEKVALMRPWFIQHGLPSEGPSRPRDAKATENEHIGWNGLRALVDIQDVVDKNPRIVGPLVGRGEAYLNRLGSDSAMQNFINWASGTRKTAQGGAADLASDPNLHAELEAQAKKLGSLNPTQDAQDAAYVISRMRMADFLELRNLIGGSRGVTTLWQAFESAMVNPAQSTTLIHGHVQAMADNIAGNISESVKQYWGRYDIPQDPYHQQLLDSLGAKLGARRFAPPPNTIQTPGASTYKVGDIVWNGGKQYKVTKILPDGKLDTDPVGTK